MKLTDLGWDPFFEKSYEPFHKKGLSAMRIIRENREKYVASGENGELICKISGKLRFKIKGKSTFPTVGDWVAVSILPGEKKATIHALLTRKNAFCRKVAGLTTKEQVVAANIETVFIVIGLDLHFNLRSIERYLSLVKESGALPVILLNKTDICAESDARIKEVGLIASGGPIHALSAIKKHGINELKRYWAPGKTIAFIGSSGAGKSTIINALLGVDRQKVNAVIGSTNRGRHTTTFRELILFPDGGMVIDTPGMRELQVWGDDDGLKEVFDDIEVLAASCRFRDCGHQNEPGCGIQIAIQNGTLRPERLESFLKIKKEFASLIDRRTLRSSTAEQGRWKKDSHTAKSAKKRTKTR